MALVKCAECGATVSSKAIQCPSCGYFPYGACEMCRYYEGKEFGGGACRKTGEMVSWYKRVCPAMVKKSLFTMQSTITKG